MAFVIKFSKRPSNMEIAKALYDAITAEGASVKKSEYHERKEVSRVVDVPGILVYGNIEYDILIGREDFRREECDASIAFDALETDEIDGIVAFAKKQLFESSSSIEHDINWLPTEERIEFLAKVAERMSKALPVESMAITYVPATAEKKRMYERIV